MKFVLEVDPLKPNAAQLDIALLLLGAAQHFYDGQCHGDLVDLAGERVGFWRIASDPIVPVELARK